MSLKSMVKRIPIIGPTAVGVHHFLGGSAATPLVEFKTSGEYWEERYRKGGNSGAGSYNRLAEFKAEFLNQFVASNDIQSVIEFGSGDGAQLTLAKYPRYTGVDVAPAAVQLCRERFNNNPTLSFIHTSEVTAALKADLSLSLDVIYHLVEDEVFATHMNSVLDAAERYAIFYASNEDKAWPNPHVRHRCFSNWIAANQPRFLLEQHVPNRYPYDESKPDNTSFADFYVFRRT